MEYYIEGELMVDLVSTSCDAANRGSVSEEEQSLGFHASYR